MTFIQDSKSSSTLTQDSRTAVGTLTQESKSGYGLSWGANFNTWAQETRTWAQLTSNLTLDLRTL